jgi:hypothetical protein
MPGLSERRIDAWTALAAEPAVRAAERAIVTGSHAVLADTLAIATATEARRRLRRVLDLKGEADVDADRRDDYLRAADDLRSWAATVYLAALRDPRARQPAPRRGSSVTPLSKPRTPATEESISIRRSIVTAPVPGQPDAAQHGTQHGHVGAVT